MYVFAYAFAVPEMLYGPRRTKRGSGITCRAGGAGLIAKPSVHKIGPSLVALSRSFVNTRTRTRVYRRIYIGSPGFLDTVNRNTSR